MQLPSTPQKTGGRSQQPPTTLTKSVASPARVFLKPTVEDPSPPKQADAHSSTPLRINMTLKPVFTPLKTVVATNVQHTGPHVVTPSTRTPQKVVVISDSEPEPELPSENELRELAADMRAACEAMDAAFYTRFCCVHISSSNSAAECDPEGPSQCVGTFPAGPFPSPVESPARSSILNLPQVEPVHPVENPVPLPSPVRDPAPLPPYVPVNGPPPFNRRAKKFYVVCHGRRCGVYTNWPYVDSLVNSIGSGFKSYKSVDEAYQSYYNNKARGNLIVARRSLADYGLFGPTHLAYDDPPAM